MVCLIILRDCFTVCWSVVTEAELLGSIGKNKASKVLFLIQNALLLHDNMDPNRNFKPKRLLEVNTVICLLCRFPLKSFTIMRCELVDQLFSLFGFFVNVLILCATFVQIQIYFEAKS